MQRDTRGGAETLELPLNRPRLRAGACSFPGFLPAAMFVAGIWSTGTYPSSLGFAKAGPRSGGGDGKLSFSKVSGGAGYDGYLSGYDGYLLD